MTELDELFEDWSKISVRLQIENVCTSNRREESIPKDVYKDIKKMYKKFAQLASIDDNAIMKAFYEKHIKNHASPLLDNNRVNFSIIDQMVWSMNNQQLKNKENEEHNHNSSLVKQGLGLLKDE